MMKKAQIMQSKVVELILLITAAVVLIYFATSVIYPIYTALGTQQACAGSVVARGSSIGQTFVKLKCDTQDVTIKSIDAGKINSQIANLMYGCWSTMGAGKINFVGRPLFKNETYCVICDKITFADNVKKTTLSFTGLKNTLIENTVPGKNITYMEYFTGGKTLDGEETPISTSQDYVVVYALTEKSRIIQTLSTSAGCIASTALGFAAGIGTGVAITGGSGGLALIVAIPAGLATGAKVMALGCGASALASSALDKAIVDAPFAASMHLLPYDEKAISAACNRMSSRS